MKLPRVRFTPRRVIALVLVVAAVIVASTTLVERNRRRARAVAEGQEARVRALIRDEPLANVGIRPAHDGLTGLLDSLGLPGPHARRGERALMTINPIHPSKGLTRLAGPTVDACRTVPDGVPAEMILLRPIPAPDLQALLGPCDAQSKGDVSRFKGLDVYTYGNLDVGIKDGGIVAIRVR